MSLRSASAGCLATLVASMAIAACGSFKLDETQALRNARQQLAEAKRDPDVRRYGGVFLKDAEQTLDRARSARADPAQAKHLAYLAKRKIEIAQSIAGLQVAAGNLQALAEKSVAGDAMAAREADRVKSADTAARKPSAGTARAKPRTAVPVVATAAAAPRPANRPNRPPEKAAGSAEKGNGRPSPDRPPEGLETGGNLLNETFAISGIFSGSGRTTLSPDAQRDLAPLVRYLRDHRNSRIIVEGFAGGAGGHEDSLSQSLGVAEAVKSYMTGEGIEGNRIFTLGRGADDPAGGGGGVPPGMVNSRIEIGLFQGAGDPTSALSSRTAPSAAPSPPPPL
ncbi:MAG: OmpA family protein [Alphaproteobacteria bacterium]|nr:OmpA family protein [Alphaproteobacteria bacterium]